MGTSGVALSFPKNQIIECIKKYKGVVSKMCTVLDVSHGPLIKYINNDPDLKQCLLEARHAFDDLLCDMAEDTLRYAVGQKEDLSSALSSAKFILNNKGKQRGYVTNTDRIVAVENFAQLQVNAIAGKIKQEETIEHGNPV